MSPYHRVKHESARPQKMHPWLPGCITTLGSENDAPARSRTPIIRSHLLRSLRQNRRGVSRSRRCRARPPFRRRKRVVAPSSAYPRFRDQVQMPERRRRNSPNARSSALIQLQKDIGRGRGSCNRRCPSFALPLQSERLTASTRSHLGLHVLPRRRHRQLQTTAAARLPQFEIPPPAGGRRRGVVRGGGGGWGGCVCQKG
jgi:hypothetical protein